MLIGKDFEKLSFELFNIRFLEINAFLGDLIICIIALVMAKKINHLKHDSAFFLNWHRFYISFGVGFFIGGVAHLMFHYLGVPGKYPSWYISVFSIFFIEQAMISLYQKPVWKKRFVLWSKIKLVAVIVAVTIFYLNTDLSVDPSKGLIIPSINTAIGFILTLSVLGYHFQKTIDVNFKFFWMSVLTLLPSAFFQALKINIHPWLDRNDISHILLILSVFLYYKGIMGYKRVIE